MKIIKPKIWLMQKKKKNINKEERLVSLENQFYLVL